MRFVLFRIEPVRFFVNEMYLFTLLNADLLSYLILYLGSS